MRRSGIFSGVATVIQSGCFRWHSDALYTAQVECSRNDSINNNNTKCTTEIIQNVFIRIFWNFRKKTLKKIIWLDFSNEYKMVFDDDWRRKICCSFEHRLCFVLAYVNVTMNQLTHVETKTTIACVFFSSRNANARRFVMFYTSSKIQYRLAYFIEIIRSNDMNNVMHHIRIIRVHFHYKSIRIYCTILIVVIITTKKKSFVDRSREKSAFDELHRVSVCGGRITRANARFRTRNKT